MSAREKEDLTTLGADERDALRSYYLSVKDEQYKRLVEARQEIDNEWRELRRRGA